MHGRIYKASLAALMGVLLTGVSFLQRSMNLDRERLGLTRIAPLENMPPLLAFTTQALGGFRGLIANFLWMRASDLQDDDKFFEAMQLTDWITKLEPYFVQVWTIEAWNMTYNISVKFSNPADRWRWVKAGIELLRDQGLKYNPKETLIYRELAWFFQHKLGHYLDDAHMYYKQQWVIEMARVFGKGVPNVDELVNPQTDDQRARAKLLREEFKMDPVFMKELDEKYGPLEWRLPEAHAIYWGALALKYAKREDLMSVRRNLYQSMQLSFYRGRLVPNNAKRTFALSPNLDLFPKVNLAYEEMISEEADPAQKAGIRKAHRNVIRDAIYFLYASDRIKEAQQWFDYLAEHYPDDHIITGRLETLPKNTDLDTYAMSRIQEELGSTSPDRTEAMVEGIARQFYFNLALGDDDKAEEYDRFARKAYDRYQASVKGSSERMGLRSLEEIKRQILDELLDPQKGLVPELRAVLRTTLRLPAETNAPPSAPASTNAANPQLQLLGSTNRPATNSPARH